MRPDFYEWFEAATQTEAGVEFTDDPAPQVQARLPMGTSGERGAITQRVAQGAEQYVASLTSRVKQLEDYLHRLGIRVPDPSEPPEPPPTPAIAA